MKRKIKEQTSKKVASKAGNYSEKANLRQLKA